MEECWCCGHVEYVSAVAYGMVLQEHGHFLCDRCGWAECDPDETCNAEE